MTPQTFVHAEECALLLLKYAAKISPSYFFPSYFFPAAGCIYSLASQQHMYYIDRMKYINLGLAYDTPLFLESKVNIK